MIEFLFIMVWLTVILTVNKNENNNSQNHSSNYNNNISSNQLLPLSTISSLSINILTQQLLQQTNFLNQPNINSRPFSLSSTSLHLLNSQELHPTQLYKHQSLQYCQSNLVLLNDLIIFSTYLLNFSFKINHPCKI